MVTKRLVYEGHLIDSGLLSKILNLIISEAADYEITEFVVGRTPDDESSMQLLLKAPHLSILQSTASKLTAFGVRALGETQAEWVSLVRDKAAPEGFYSTTNHRTEVFDEGEWKSVSSQRMDAAIVRSERGLSCVKLRDLAAGDRVLVGSASVRVYPPEVAVSGADSFSFMANEVSSERNAIPAAQRIAEEMRSIKKRGGRIIAVAGPVVVHTGGADALASLVRDGWVGGLLGGNAIAVHDLESRLYGTSLGVDLATGRPTHEGHKNHMMAINTVYEHGSIAGTIEAGVINGGLMYEVIKAGIPYSLAGSIRDDGPLPETEMDMIKAQKAYADIIAGCDMILMLSTMLHSIGTGNMTPSWVRTVCVDINPAVVTKLSDRGSSQAVGVVSDVGLFLRALAAECLRWRE